RGGVVDAFENVRCGLVDRGCARASRGVGLRAGMDRKRGKSRDAFGHAPFLWAGPWRYSRRGGRLPFLGRGAPGVVCLFCLDFSNHGGRLLPFCYHFAGYPFFFWAAFSASSILAAASACIFGITWL